MELSRATHTATDKDEKDKLGIDFKIDWSVYRFLNSVWCLQLGCVPMKLPKQMELGDFWIFGLFESVLGLARDRHVVRVEVMQNP